MLMKKHWGLLVIGGICSWACISSSLAVAADAALVKIDLQKKIAVLHAIEMEKAKKVDVCVTAGHTFAYCASQVMSGYICTKKDSSSGSGGAGNQGAVEACMAAGGTIEDCSASSGLSGVGG